MTLWSVFINPVTYVYAYVCVYICTYVYSYMHTLYAVSVYIETFYIHAYVCTPIDLQAFTVMAYPCCDKTTFLLILWPCSVECVDGFCFSIVLM